MCGRIVQNSPLQTIEAPCSPVETEFTPQLNRKDR
jgi:hypothetical protein